ncbi:beta-phosphoglucomutase [Morganella morganii]|jgi:beta-phosphoglucomutase|uniref:beta-phosphoglucomutase n=1 Tax=Morganella TaxID=581 RepID=UPI0029464AFE|nr:beta-phosphoglucomutase [Morganella morganii]
MKSGFLFDLDGVIVDTAKYHYIAWRYIANKAGFDISEEFNENLKGISRMESLEKILEYGRQSDMYSHEEKRLLSDEKNDYYVKLLGELSEKDILPGVHDFIVRANMLNIPCAVASASRNAPFILKKLNIDNYFKSIVDPALLSKGKPDPEIFLKAALSVNVLPQDAIGFEDAQSGITALNRAGVFSVGVTGDHALLRGADLIISSFEEITPEYVLKIKQ